MQKERLEEKQRAARKERAKNDEEWSTRCVCVCANGAHSSWLTSTRSDLSSLDGS